MHDRDSNDARTPDAMREERDRLRAHLDACRHDLRQARVELARAREIEESLTEQLHAQARGDAGAGESTTAVSSRERRPVWPVRVWQRMTMPESARTLLADIQLLHGSEWFDADWYLTEYPDVANAGADPAEHYLRSGGAEGRNPGPLFNTDAYMRDHPDLSGSGVNALVHFLRSQRGERP